MKNAKLWVPSKFIIYDGALKASRNPTEVSVGSRLVADLTASWYQENLKEFASGDLLDLGCGKAPLYGVYKSLVTSVTLADWDNSLHENKHLDMACDITKKLPFNNNSFDTIILSDVLEHIPNPNDVLTELKRILRPNGIVLMNVPFMYWVHEAPHDFYRYTEFMLRKLVEDQEMIVVKLDALAGGWAVLLDVASKLFVNKTRMVKFIQKFGPRILAKKLNSRTEIPLAYTMVFKKGL